MVRNKRRGRTGITIRAGTHRYGSVEGRSQEDTGERSLSRSSWFITFPGRSRFIFHYFSDNISLSSCSLWFKRHVTPNAPRTYVPVKSFVHGVSIRTPVEKSHQPKIGQGPKEEREKLYWRNFNFSMLLRGCGKKCRVGESIFRTSTNDKNVVDAISTITKLLILWKYQWD